ncbi:GNAT family protein [Scandinavium sp. V105_16]|uniref:GNAT family protein n=1 Tax=Scandinavium lactucae TaxID=3095028 RepID=A0AAJ2VQW1_9ENTR|nr:MULTISPECIES: GNAT family protein [unclassified Scandinavium]MDX6018774.1 GNAT family protein [Scandinavium sp. V105_16]MDX6030265.1 GNAT family protein [Scandinavium sp. V105_12]MDX6039069.1 GNAT family protein [Scandinavium sp. V105_6]MDX6050140.1 GNAT family protein [Scandinavium sp. V105_1]
MAQINEYGQTVGDPMPDWQGADLLARKVLQGRCCRLEPLNAQRHAPDLFDAYAQVDDERDWTWLSSVRPQSVAAAQVWLQGKVDDAGLVPFAVIDISSERAVGVVCLMAIDRPNGSVEIGHVTWSQRMKRSIISTEVVWLLLREAFACGYRRVEWKTDALNTASRQAAERIGFTFEGRFRQRMVRKGRNRDSDVLSIIDGEWSAIDATLQAWLAERNFDANGQQLRRLESFRE